MLALPLVFVLLLGAVAPQDERTVTKASVYLVKSPSFLAPRVSEVTVHRGEKVRLLGPGKGAWHQVTYKPKKGRAITGFIHLSYLSDRPAAFRVDQQEVPGTGLLSGHYNLAVPGLREEDLRQMQQTRKDASRGYAVVDRYMPLQMDAASLAQPRDPTLLARFLTQGRLHEPVEPSDEAPASRTP
jgi:hypothetical protein